MKGAKTHDDAPGSVDEELDKIWECMKSKLKALDVEARRNVIENMMNVINNA